MYGYTFIYILLRQVNDWYGRNISFEYFKASAIIVQNTPERLRTREADPKPRPVMNCRGDRASIAASGNATRS